MVRPNGKPQDLLSANVGVTCTKMDKMLNWLLKVELKDIKVLKDLTGMFIDIFK